MSNFSKADLLVLEEILYSPLSFPISRLEKNTKLTSEQLKAVLKKLSKTNLFQIEGNTISVDKELRKYFELQILKFEEDFIPDLEFLQNMLKKVPIHVLPTWYSIPRTSDNIFQSLIDKFFLTPQSFQRYLMDLNLGNPLLNQIVHDVFNAPDLKIPSSHLIQKYDLTQEKFEEMMLFLEFNLLCCLGYDRINDSFIEIVTPFREWREYLFFIRTTTPASLRHSDKLVRRRPSDFGFVGDVTALLKGASNSPIPLKELSRYLDGFAKDTPEGKVHLEHLLGKMKLLKLADVANQTLYPLENARDFLNMRPENQAIYIYRHPHNRIMTQTISPEILNEKNLRETEKAIQRVLNAGWVYFDDFLKGAMIPLSEETKVKLVRRGKSWKYSFPNYSDEEVKLIRTVLFETLFEAGIVAVGEQNQRPCFCVTPFGQNLFGG